MNFQQLLNSKTTRGSVKQRIKWTNIEDLKRMIKKLTKLAIYWFLIATSTVNAQN